MGWFPLAERKTMSSRHVLVLGGARSGKTGFAERLAMGAGISPAYLATAQALDSEMRDRVESHRRQREGRFETIEEPLQLPMALARAAGRHDAILVDCLTLWITNLLGAGHDVAAAVDDLSATLTKIESSRVILVSNEVGLGIVPDNPLARTFRDLAGSTHQRLAEICDDVYFVIAGLPLTLKGVPPEQN
jgi:adenosylcobinamide kinase/adenosylcobinamide-phosphate guanylyltransferase